MLRQYRRTELWRTISLRRLAELRRLLETERIKYTIRTENTVRRRDDCEASENDLQNICIYSIHIKRKDLRFARVFVEMVKRIKISEQ